MARLQWLLFLLVSLACWTVAVDAVNVTLFPKPPKPKRDIGAASTLSEWVVVLSCTMATDRILALRAVFPAALSSCDISRAAQSSASTLLNIDCNTKSITVDAAAIDRALALALVPQECRLPPRYHIMADVADYRASSTPPWHLDRDDQRGPDLDGAPYTPRNGATGAGIVIYHIDTGVRTTHVEFGPGSSRATILMDLAGDSTPGDGGDCNGHGTHTASLAIGHTLGVAAGATVRAYRALLCDGTGYLSDIVIAMMDVADRQMCAGCAHAAVLSMSISGPQNDIIDSHASDLVFNYGVAVVVAAGNQGSVSCTYSPASAAGVLGVAAMTRVDSLASFSNYGVPCTSIAAPGVQVLGAYNYDDTSTITHSGTSQATPQVAGAVALLMQLGGAVPGQGAQVQAQVVALASAPGSDRISGLFPPLFVGKDVCAPPLPLSPTPTPSLSILGTPLPPPPPPQNPPPPPHDLVMEPPWWQAPAAADAGCTDGTWTWSVWLVFGSVMAFLAFV